MNTLLNNGFPVLETERLRLVEITQEHLEDLFKLFGDGSVTKYYNIKTFKEPKDGQLYLDWFINRFKEGLGIRWGIQLKGEAGIIGTIGFNNFTKNHRANLGYDLQSAYWGKGYIPEALEAVIQYGFGQLQINRIEAEVMVGNIASEKVLLKAGFQQEGILREWMYWDNRYFDMVMYSRIKEEYIKEIQ